MNSILPWCACVHFGSNVEDGIWGGGWRRCWQWEPNLICVPLIVNYKSNLVCNFMFYMDAYLVTSMSLMRKTKALTVLSAVTPDIKTAVILQMNILSILPRFTKIVVQLAVVISLEEHMQM